MEILRAIPGAPDVEIEMVGTDSIIVESRPVQLTRYTVANIVFGREILWMNPQGQLAALMTFAGGLPFEAVRTRIRTGAERIISCRRSAGNARSRGD